MFLCVTIYVIAGVLRSKYQCENLSFGDKELENNEGLGKLLFELASECRLAILRELHKENLKIQIKTN